MKQICFAIIIALGCFVPSVSSQTLSYDPVRKGEMVPDISLRLEQSGTGKLIRMSELRGKLVIFDFWGIYCKPCIEAFPKMVALQRKFNDQIKIIIVNPASHQYIDSVFKTRARHSRTRIPDLPGVYSDSLLRQLFPNNIIPHYTWIGKDGKLIAHTGGGEVTEEKIMAVLENSKFKLREKADLMDYAVDLPMFPQLLERQTNPLIYYSGITRWMDGFHGAASMLKVDSVQKSVRVTRPPCTILMLVCDALTKHRVFSSPFESAKLDYGKRVILDVADSSRYFYKINDSLTLADWIAEHKFGYEGVFPLSDKEKVYELMLADLCRYFQLEARFEKRRMKCLAIVRTSAVDKIKYQGGKFLRGGRVFTDTAGVFHLFATSFVTFRDKLADANRYTELIFTDHTNYPGSVDLEIHSSLSDIPKLKTELQLKYDLDLVELEEELEVMVIRER